MNDKRYSIDDSDRVIELEERVKLLEEKIYVLKVFFDSMVRLLRK